MPKPKIVIRPPKTGRFKPRAATTPSVPERPRRQLLIRKLANIEDEATGDAYELYVFRKPLNGVGKLRWPRHKAWDVRGFREVLIGKNWAAPHDRVEAESLVDKAVRSEPRDYWLCAAHVGWRPNFAGFVLHRRVVGAPGGDPILKPPFWLSEHRHVVLSAQGDLATWIEMVAKPSQFSSRLMLMMSAAFAAPLVRIAGLQPFAILLFGKSKTGKTTALLAAASVIGIGRESQLPNFNTTDAAFLEKARLFNDLILPGNEVGLVKGAKKDIYARIRGLLYAFAEGQDTARHSASTFASARSSATWRGIFLPNSEHSFDALAEMAGEKRDPGEYARCTDVPARAEKYRTIFDYRPDNITPSEFPRWCRQNLTALRTACEENHGVAIAPFIEFLIKRGDRVRDDVRRYMDEFEAALDLNLDDGALQHAAQNFALVYAGGRLAIEAGILPWNPKDLLEAIVTCFASAMRELGRHESILSRAQEILRKKLRDEKLPPKGDGADPDKQDGFQEEGTDGVIYTVKAAAMREWFPDPAHFRAILSWLNDERLLIKADGAPKPSPKGTEWAVTTPRWSGERKVKSIRFKAPAEARA